MLLVRYMGPLQKRAGLKEFPTEAGMFSKKYGLS